jgi:hypothetical protein
VADFYANKGPAPVAVAAAGSGQSTATLLQSGVASNVSAADGTKAVVLPAASAGEVVRVYNSVATNGLPIYPPTSGTINGGSANAAITIEGKTFALLECMDGTNWAAVFTANS